MCWRDRRWAASSSPPRPGACSASRRTTARLISVGADWARSRVGVSSWPAWPPTSPRRTASRWPCRAPTTPSTRWRTPSAPDWTPVNAQLPDLALCAQEPIRVPGAIQPHGWMAVVAPDDELVAYSANWADADRAARAVRMVLDRSAEVGTDDEGPAALGTIT